MENKKTSKYLFDLAVSGLISEAEFDIFNPDSLLNIPIERKRYFYLADVLKDTKLKSYFEINKHKGQLTIHSHSLLSSLKKQWYKGNLKIFSNILDPNLINLQSIVLCINLFGSRKLETISIPTSIGKEYIKAISYCIEQHLKVPIIPSANCIKVTNIPYFISSVVNELPVIHSAELMNFLTEKEKKRLMEGASM